MSGPAAARESRSFSETWQGLREVFPSQRLANRDWCPVLVSSGFSMSPPEASGEDQLTKS